MISHDLEYEYEGGFVLKKQCDITNKRNFFRFSVLVGKGKGITLFGLLLYLILPLAAKPVLIRDIQSIRSERLFHQGILHINMHHYLAAVEELVRARSLNAKDPDLRYFLAKAYTLAGFRDQAIEEWKRLVQDFPSHALAQEKLEALVQRDIPREKPTYSLLNRFSQRGRDFRYGFDLALDPKGGVWVLGLESRNVVRYLSDGTRSLRIRPGNSNLGIPYSLAVSTDRIYISDYKNNVVHLFDLQGRSLGVFGKKGDEQPGLELLGPTGLWVVDDGSLFIADSGNHRIVKVSARGDLQYSFGSSGQEKGKLLHPVAIASTGSSGELFVLEKGNRRVQHFDSFGNALGVYQSDLIQEPVHMKLYDNTLYIVDEKSGIYSFHIPSKQFFSRPLDQVLEMPDKKDEHSYRALAWDSSRHLYLLEHNQDEIQVFAPTDYKVSNLDVQVMQIDRRRFPVLGMRVRVQSGNGTPVTTLRQNHFMILDEGVRMQRVNTESFQRNHNFLRLVFLVENSEAMVAHRDDLEWVLDSLLAKMVRQERMRVMHFSDQVVRRTDYDWSVRRTKKEILNVQSGRDNNTGKALYGALSELAPLSYQKGIVLLTSGETGVDGFQQYSLANLENFALQHDIPIYILSFQKEPAHGELRSLAEVTGGKWLSMYDSHKIGQIPEALRSRARSYYQLSFRTFTNEKLKERFRKVVVKVEHMKQIGSDIGGYINP